MKSDSIRELRENQYDAEDYCYQAKREYSLKNRHTKTEAELYIKAAACYKKNEELSVKEDQQYYKEKKEECADLARKIIDLLNGEKKQVVNGASSGKSAGSNKNDGAKAGTAKQTSGGKEEIDTSQWFREKPKHSFVDVAGMDALKKKLISCAADAKFAGLKKFLKMKNLNSFFFYGPPGCGKTFIIDAFANEMMEQGYKYIYLEAKDILSKYVGEAETKVSRMFELAEESAPCIVFIDEIESVCRNRNLPNMPEHKASLTTAFLTGYNRINESDKEIVFIGATNCPWDVDSAMLSRVELIRVPLPDYDARRGYFEHVVGRENIACTVPVELMVKMTEGYDCRDIERILFNAKIVLYERVKEKYDNQEQAIQALKNGEFVLDEALFRKVYEEYVPFPKKTVLESMAKWESERGVIPDVDEEFDKGKSPDDTKGADDDKTPDDMKGADDDKTPDTDKAPDCGTAGAFNLKFLKKEKKVTAVFDKKHPGKDANGKIRVHNPLPDTYTEYAFCHAERCYEKESVHWQESARRYREALIKELASLSTQQPTTERDQKIQEINWILGKLNDKCSIGTNTTYKGIHDSGFAESYDGFNTVWQGNAIIGFRGTCGIVASCNVINQQTGTRLREEDGIHEFVAQGLCYVNKKFAENGYEFPADMTEEEKLKISCDNGGTTSIARGFFIRSHGVNFEAVVDRSYRRRKKLIQKMSTPPELTLELMEKRMREGDSIELTLKIQDLVQPGLSNRKVSWDDPMPAVVNHATTVAGFSYGESGAITGVWINETGHATESTRVFISAEKFALMRDNTRGFSAEFMRKREVE